MSALLTRMLAKDPDGRPGSAGDLADEIGALIETLIAEGHVTSERVEARTRTVVPHLATAEQRVVCVILVSRPRELLDREPGPGTWDVPGAGRRGLTTAFDESTFSLIREAVAPFGGKEGKEAQTNFDYKTGATQVLFLQHVIRSLRDGGRCAIGGRPNLSVLALGRHALDGR